MAFNSSGQVSYLVLDSLSSGSKYGLEIIEHISQKTGGNYIMKKPTLYSCLTRMEKKGLVSSSYWGESELGGKRHYYTITPSGRESLRELSYEFENVDYSQSFSSFEETSTPQNFQPNRVEEETKPVFLQQDNLFNLVKEEPQPEKTQTAEEKSDIVENQMDFFSFQSASQEEQKSEPQEDVNEQDRQKMEYYQSILESTPAKDDGIFLSDDERIFINETSSETQPEEEENEEPQKEVEETVNTIEEIDQETVEEAEEEEEIPANTHLTEVQEQQNKLIYDTSSELKKYRKRKSFSENQIEMSVVYSTAEDIEIQKQRIEELKRSMLSARENRVEQLNDKEERPAVTERIETYVRDFNSQNVQPVQSKVEPQPEPEPEHVDDAVFITERIESPIQRKISPANLDIDVNRNNMPAPKRNSELEPTYKDMMSKLFEQRKEKPKAEPKEPTPPPPTQESQNFSDTGSFVDYQSLKAYYKGHGIEFKEYRKINVERHHNTNFLTFMSSLIMLLLSGIASAVTFGIIAGAQLLNASTNFLFYTVPALFFVFCIFAFIRHKVMPSKRAAFAYNGVINWAVFALGCVIVLIANVIAGMQYEIIGQYLTSLLLPAIAILIAFPINYYIKKLIFKKYAK